MSAVLPPVVSGGRHARPADHASGAPHAGPDETASAAAPGGGARPAPATKAPRVTVNTGGPAPVTAAPVTAAVVADPQAPPVPAAEHGAPEPVADVARMVRRKNVIGAETTGSIPVHLLFRDEPGDARPSAARDDDGGPDTVAMAAPILAVKGRGSAVPVLSKAEATETRPRRAKTAPDEPSPSRTDGGPKARSTSRSTSRPEARQASPSKAQPGAPSPAHAKPRTSASRPAPTADPDLVERSAQVLPGWVGVVGGALALAWCAAVVWWVGAVPAEAARMLRLPERPYHGIHLGQWALLALGVVLVLFTLGGLGRGRVGYAWVLTLFGDYRGTVRRTGLVWVSPLLLRRRVDVRLRHWRSEPLSAVDAKGTALDVTVLVVWRVRDTVQAALGVDGHEEYLREQVEAAMARVLSQLPADAFHEDAPTLRDAEAVGEALTGMLSAECAPVGLDVFSAQPTRIEYAPEVAAAMRRRRIAAIDAKHRDSVLTSVVDAVDDVVHRLTSRGLVELDDYERKSLVKDLTVAFYTGRTGPVEGA
ncbi:SPFH domain-containing protein [Streptomyces sp. MSC1_001]|uniref:SPFH domain-containing protein n=1 Tax=Streptomyces sp. MSC1_001 TaxID=2909263 RepID=UPI00203037CC|nr:SPFH domain-containing protein [Streptomyces sp. MSC1_001]